MFFMSLIHVLVFTPDWTVGSATFLASTVEFVEAVTIVLVVGITINWKSSLLGSALAALALAVLVAIFGLTLVKYIPITSLRLFVGVILVMFGMKWLKKALLRYSGRKAFHDEEAIYEEEKAILRARGEGQTNQIDGFGVLTAFKSVLLEGLEVAFIVIFAGTITSNHEIAAVTQADRLSSAVIGAVVAGVLVIATGALVRAPLARVPENTLKFVVGVMLTSFGTLWGAEGLGIDWNASDLVILPSLAAAYLLASYVAVQVLRPRATATTQAAAQH